MTRLALDPVLAAELAQDVYALAEGEVGVRRFLRTHSDIVASGRHYCASTTTSGSFYRTVSNFAIFFVGKGRYKNQAFVVVRGTASIADALSDINVGARNTGYGTMAHAGFVAAKEELTKPLNDFIATAGNIKCFHVIGHSLGGGVANLLAEQLKAGPGEKRNVKLYTFGAPRVGDKLFSQRLTQKLGSHNIFRVTHTSDPVPMVPVWPFFHAAYGDMAYERYSPYHPFKYHLMTHYVDSMQKAKTWSYLGGLQTMPVTIKFIESFLLNDKSMGLTAYSIKLISIALRYIQQGTLTSLSIGLGAASASYFSLMDRLAYMLHKDVQVDKSKSSLSSLLIKKLCIVLGIKQPTETSFSHSFIRFVLQTFYHRAMSVMRMAVAR